MTEILSNDFYGTVNSFILNRFNLSCSQNTLFMLFIASKCSSRCSIKSWIFLNFKKLVTTFVFFFLFRESYVVKYKYICNSFIDAVVSLFLIVITKKKILWRKFNNFSLLLILRKEEEEYFSNFTERKCNYS